MDRIVVTDNEWFKYLKNREFETVNFWRKDTRKIKNLEVGDKVFFLVKNDKNEIGERKIGGYGLFADYNICTIDSAWEKYKTKNGCDNKKVFLSKITHLYNNIEASQIGCIELSSFRVFNNLITPSMAEVEFPNNIVNTKTITSEEVYRLLSLEKK